MVTNPLSRRYRLPPTGSMLDAKACSLISGLQDKRKRIMIDRSLKNDLRRSLNWFATRPRHQEQPTGAAAASVGDLASINTESLDNQMIGQLLNIDRDAFEATCRRHRVRHLALSGPMANEASGTDSGVLWTLRNTLERPIQLVDKDAIARGICARWRGTDADHALRSLSVGHARLTSRAGDIQTASTARPFFMRLG